MTKKTKSKDDKVANSLDGFFSNIINIFMTEIQGDTEYVFVFSPNAENYGPENSKYGHFSRSAYLN